MGRLVDIKRFHPSATNRRRLPVAIPPQAQIAQVSNPEALFEGAHYFSPTQETELQGFGPQVLLGSSDDLLSLVQAIEQRRLNLGQLNRAILVLTSCRDALLRNTTRTVFWQTFGVPVYELFLGGNGSLLAAECEAYEGWHIESGITFSCVQDQLWYRTRHGYLAGTGLVGSIETELCSCGRAGKRLVNVQIDFQDAVRHRLPVSA